MAQVKDWRRLGSVLPMNSKVTRLEASWKERTRDEKTVPRRSGECGNWLHSTFFSG
jgi:hypothetical protein